MEPRCSLKEERKNEAKSSFKWLQECTDLVRKAPRQISSCSSFASTHLPARLYFGSNSNLSAGHLLRRPDQTGRAARSRIGRLVEPRFVHSVQEGCFGNIVSALIAATLNSSWGRRLGATSGEHAKPSELAGSEKFPNASRASNDLAMVGWKRRTGDAHSNWVSQAAKVASSGMAACEGRGN